ncbi:transferrin-like isoform X1 [Formica exsecta]|uniref:transferrin-like isoform X1 n=1 Tax=Formica exsecta TaxID=72781 RepID=UPI001141656A|nr:transferrin-like isoform X1 [Formica exsecta]XP_029670880.1 transferrin-like isoform X1 [Formica exsecta]XP_029670881.1 transferrin-like isoform X1 [Formica exsecta]
MRNIVWVILLLGVARAQQEYKLCAPVDTISDDACYALQRGESKVSCLRVADSAECAIRLVQGAADFGVFNAEELLLTYQFYPLDILPILQLRHRDKLGEDFEFQTVAVVPADFTQKVVSPGERLKQLKGGGFCHPGFSKSQWWNDYILKYFENIVNRPRCQENVTIIENEIRNLKDFFGKACRPGEWIADSSFDQELKNKYPELCDLCDDRTACTYNNMEKHGHLGALDCLTHRNGKVAYVALSYVREYLRTNASFQFLCPNGNILPLTTETPCAWLKQPWSVVAARKEIAKPLKNDLLKWLNSSFPFGHKENDWEIVLNRIIQEDSRAIDLMEMSLATYLSKGREIDISNIETCGKTIRWCTIGDLETNKCTWVAKAARTLGVEPSISCIRSNSTFECFRDIAEDRADIITIDSNYGYLARTVYDLSTVLYSETEMDKNSVIIAIVRESKDNIYPIKNFYDLKNRKACFPEYGGISWLSFTNIARTDGIISSKSCDYSLLVSKLLSGACTPGIEDADHARTAISADVSSKLCSACRYQNNTSCAVNETNRYYNDKGAMRCLSEGVGDVAFVEAANIIKSDIDPYMYRILCRNGSLAEFPGFKFDEFCALSVTIDSELVGRKNDTQISRTNTVLALLKIEDWLGYRVSPRRPIRIYGPFNSTLDLLFKDSTSGLVTTSSTKKSVLAYKELFSHVDECSTGSFVATTNFVLVALITLYHFLFNHIH